jgi:hypothetical protein
MRRIGFFIAWDLLDPLHPGNDARKACLEAVKAQRQRSGFGGAVRPAAKALTLERCLASSASSAAGSYGRGERGILFRPNQGGGAGADGGCDRHPQRRPDPLRQSGENSHRRKSHSHRGIAHTRKMASRGRRVFVRPTRWPISLGRSGCRPIPASA